MAYTTIDDPTAYFQTHLYAGSNSDITATFSGNSDLQPDWIWFKSRSSDNDHLTYDSVRGVGKRLQPNATDAEVDRSGNNDELKSFNTNGWTLGTFNSNITGAGKTCVSWNWKAGTSFTNDASSTGIGSIDSAGSVSTDAGFSIIRWSGTGSNATIAHGLGSAPKMMIIKRISGGTESWIVYHQAISPAKHLFLNSTDAANADTNNFQNTATTSSVFSVGTYNQMNASGTNNMIAYCFAEKQGYSKFGSYIANSNSSNFIYTGMKPAFLMVKQTDSGGNQNWGMFDNKRPGYNSQNGFLYANSTAAEDTSNATSIDLLSNGFQLRANTVGSNPGKSYIYMAFAENPFVTSTGVPATAR